MIFTGLTITILLGIVVVLSISQRLKWIETIGLAFPVGIGVQTFLMVCMDFAGIKLTATSVITASVLLIAGSGVYLYVRRNTFKEWITGIRTFSYPKFNWLWLACIVVLAAITVMNVTKTMYYPTFDTDSVRGFNLFGMAVAHEGTFKNLTLFNDVNYYASIRGAGSYMTYMPLSQLAYAYAYLLGSETSKIINALIFISFLLSFYGVLSRFATHTMTAITTLFMTLTPEMLGFSSMSGTNFTHALYASLAILFLVAWRYQKIPSFLWIAATMLMLNNWTRSEGLAFIGAACCILCRQAVKTKQYKTFFLFTALCLFPFIFWNIFLKVNQLEAVQVFIFKPFWDSEKMTVIGREMWALFSDLNLYGLTFPLFALILLSNGWHLVKKRDQAVTLILIGMAWLFYTLLVYQINYLWDSLENVMRYSYKRFLFSFMPLLWFYIATNRNIKWISDKIDDFVFPVKKVPER